MCSAKLLRINLFADSKICTVLFQLFVRLLQLTNDGSIYTSLLCAVHHVIVTQSYSFNLREAFERAVTTAHMI